ncbi:uncharacterized protein LOC125038516 isoform X2 [Penaeus chinensis]|nr:uncharacterized protein LOC125038516 isoform X2 [Penaeus chinensis]XP_047487958.1 uncharacterized protein LOC125038516 isoform X2 [Penaeus chinensis]XP_047487959.1 uncharacterized protein LOC125038516 isoform X2 [Penaeus chinensis]XP_047487961.1 uncharacterized protein LOC125038516 isoform X2 [Penaeus chinensis]XP_047487962.1 uncharacterized protein LOC125038516 isoform X2 [Penaeus chinensis]XP_047487963.1 uncharacterized protein LOC125038516 isoform X2 [Penaeus chinensis]
MASEVTPADSSSLVEPLTINVTPCTDFQGPPMAYRNESTPRGALFLANYCKFSNPKIKPRQGSDVDSKHILELFNQMGYSDIKVILDATKEQTLTALQQFNKEEIHSNVDSLVVVFMSHGVGDAMLTSDEELIQDAEVIEFFDHINCPALIGKPKLFIFQHCRGPQEHIAIAKASTDSKSHGQTSVQVKYTRRKISDVYVCYSTIPGFLSYRCNHHGSPYINKLCKVFMEEAHHTEIDGLMKKVERILPEEQGAEIRKLMVKWDFYFNPYSREERLSVRSRDAMDNGETYRTTSSPRGHVLIINDLEGCEQDIEKLQEIFRTLGFNVLPPCKNLMKEEMKEILHDFSKIHHHDSAVVIFYGAGNGDYLVSSDHLATSFGEFTKMFNDINCPSLAGKPKLFILNTCFAEEVELHNDLMDVTNLSYQQGPDEQSGLSIDGNTELDMAQGTVYIPAERDIYLLIVEVDGQCNEGSLLTNALYQVLLNHACDKELMTLTKMILHTLEDLQKTKGGDQYYLEVRTMKFLRDYYFNPPKAAQPPSPPPRHREIHLEKDYFSQRRLSVKQVKQPRNTHSDYWNWSRPHGLALIIYFDKYESKRLPDCPWRQYNAKMMSQLYSAIGYRTEMCSNPTNSEAKSCLEEFSVRREHSDLDSAVVVILGLSKDCNSFYCGDGEPLHLSDIYSHFTDTSCLALKRKPKFFFFHMTEMQERVYPRESPRKELRDAFVVRLVSKVDANGLHPSKGLCAWKKALEEHAHDTHLESLVSKAEDYLHDGACNTRVMDEHFEREPCFLTGKFFLNPNKI